jgi:hypothetical protein
MTYSFACPLPCRREFKVDAEDNSDAVNKMIMAGAISCRNSKNPHRCPGAHFDLSPIPDSQLQRIVSLGLRQE